MQNLCQKLPKLGTQINLKSVNLADKGVQKMKRKNYAKTNATKGGATMHPGHGGVRRKNRAQGRPVTVATPSLVVFGRC